jgi:hypothetical protein
MNNIDQILSDNYEQLDKLKSELKQIENLKERIQELKDSNEKLPEEFQKRFQLIIVHATEYNENLGNSVKLFIEGNNDILVKNINQIENNISQFKKNNDDFKNEIIRLSKIDLVEHFKKLSEVFILVNGINGILTTISQNINKIIQNFGEIEQTLSKNQKEINKGFDVVKENQEKATNDLLNKLKESDNKLDAIVSQNELIKKEFNFNKKLGVTIIFLTILLIILIFFFKNK